MHLNNDISDIVHFGLRVVNLHKNFGSKQAVNGVNFVVPPGEIIGLVGPNGAGKTTSFYMTAGFIRPSKGHIYLDNWDITHLSMSDRAKYGLSYLPQESSVFKKMTVYDNLLVALEIQRYTYRSYYAHEIQRVLKEFDIAHLANQYAYTLSGGEKRRLEIARAIITKPRFVLLDEPFAGVDPIAIISIKEMIQQLAIKGIGILLTDHNIREILDLASTSYVIYKGEIIVYGDQQTIVNNDRVRLTYIGDALSQINKY